MSDADKRLLDIIEQRLQTKNGVPPTDVRALLGLVKRMDQDIRELTGAYMEARGTNGIHSQAEAHVGF